MAGILTAAPNALGKIIYRQAGKFISRSKYMREIRRGPGGRFKSRVDFIRDLNTRGLESYLRDVFGGGPLGGGNWVARVRKSSEKFADVLAERNLL